MRIWIDNDACPRRVRDIIYKAGKRLSVPIIVVANSYTHPPAGQQVEMITVGSSFDAADDYIAENVQPDDLVITADVPLAARIVDSGAVAISARGRIFTPETIREQLAMRNLAQELRSAGDISGGQKALSDLDIKEFASNFDRLLTATLKKQKP